MDTQVLKADGRMKKEEGGRSKSFGIKLLGGSLFCDLKKNLGEKKSMDEEPTIKKSPTAAAAAAYLRSKNSQHISLFPSSSSSDPEVYRTPPP